MARDLICEPVVMWRDVVTARVSPEMFLVSMCEWAASLFCSLVNSVAGAVRYVLVVVFGGVVCEKKRVRLVLAGFGVGVRERLCGLLLGELMCRSQNASKFPDEVRWCPMRLMQSILG